MGQKQETCACYIHTENKYQTFCGHYLAPFHFCTYWLVDF